MIFKLDAVLSVITGINFTHFGNVCRLMDYMVSDDLADIGRVVMQPKCRDALLAQFPALADATPPNVLNVAVAWPLWLAAMVARHGNEFDVQPIRVIPSTPPPGGHDGPIESCEAIFALD